MFPDDEIEFDDSPAVPSAPPAFPTMSPDMTANLMALGLFDEDPPASSTVHVPARNPRDKTPCFTHMLHPAPTSSSPAARAPAFQGGLTRPTPAAKNKRRTKTPRPRGFIPLAAFAAVREEHKEQQTAEPVEELREEGELLDQVADLATAIRLQQRQLEALEGSAYINGPGWTRNQWLFAVCAFVYGLPLFLVLSVWALKTVGRLLQ